MHDGCWTAYIESMQYRAATSAVVMHTGAEFCLWDTLAGNWLFNLIFMAETCSIELIFSVTDDNNELRVMDKKREKGTF